jgi:hypothetical protein
VEQASKKLRVFVQKRDAPNFIAAEMQWVAAQISEAQKIDRSLDLNEISTPGSVLHRIIRYLTLPEKIDKFKALQFIK